VTTWSSTPDCAVALSVRTSRASGRVASTSATIVVAVCTCTAANQPAASRATATVDA
jgi:hypothetical protein